MDVVQIIQDCENIIGRREISRFEFVTISLERVLLLVAVEEDTEENQRIGEHVNDLLTSMESIEASLHVKRRPGQPKIEIPKESLEELLELKFSGTSIASMYRVSFKTISRRLKEYGMSVRTSYSNITDDELQEVMTSILVEHPFTGYKRMLGFLTVKGYKITTRRVQECMRIVDPLGVAARTLQNRAIHRRLYFVRYSMERWHLDTNMKLTRRYKIIIRSAIDGCTRTCVYLTVGTDNKSSSNLRSFMDGVREWGVPRAIRCDKGGENYGIGRFMLTLRGIDSKSVLAGRSVHNQRIERFWVDVYRESRFFIQIFNTMELDGVLNIDNAVHLFVLHYVFVPRMQRSYDEFRNGWNNHKISTESSRTPLQLMILKRHPEYPENFSQQELHNVYTTCLAFQDGITEPYDSVRNPSPIIHNLNESQVERLHAVDVLAPSNNYGVDIFEHCLNILAH